jgi:hypothetical protein
VVNVLASLASGSSPVRGIPSATIDPTDVIALVLMALLSIRRIELRATDARAFPSISPAAFEWWFAAALHARNLSVNACFLKFFLNNVWFYGLRGQVSPVTLRDGGVVIFVVWLLVLGYSFWLGSRAKNRARSLGIVIGRRLVAGAAPAPVSEESRRAGEASSR